MHSDRLHHLLMDLFRTAGLVLTDGAVPGRPSSLSQVFALHELDHEAGLSQRELAERLGLEKSTVSRLVADLEADGLMTRERDPANRRLYRLEITDAGRRLHREIAASLHQRYLRWSAAMTPAEREGLETGLPALLRAMHADAGPEANPHAECGAEPGAGTDARSDAGPSAEPDAEPGAEAGRG